MIVVAIIAAIAAFSIPKISNRKSEAQAILRKFIVLSRDLRNRAKLQNATYRIAIDLGDPVKKTGQAFWVEKASGEVINDYDPKNPPKIQKESDKKNDEEAEKTPTQFSPDPSIYKKPQELPPPLEFSEVELAFLEEPVESGIVYIHFKPSGYADESAIHLSTSEKSKWTIYIQPLTGRAEIINEDRPLENLRPKWKIMASP